MSYDEANEKCYADEESEKAERRYRAWKRRKDLGREIVFVSGLLDDWKVLPSKGLTSDLISDRITS